MCYVAENSVWQLLTVMQYWQCCITVNVQFVVGDDYVFMPCLVSLFGIKCFNYPSLYISYLICIWAPLYSEYITAHYLISGPLSKQILWAQIPILGHNNSPQFHAWFQELSLEFSAILLNLYGFWICFVGSARSWSFQGQPIIRL